MTGFAVSAEAYDGFMGRYSRPLAERFVELVAVEPRHQVLDVGCGPGALTALLAGTVGPQRVSAVDPEQRFVDAVRERVPGADVRVATAERLPYADGSFDRTLAQLVVHFLADPVAGLREMARTTRPDGIVAASVWDHEGQRGPLSPFWRAVRNVDPDAAGEAHLAGVREGHLARLFADAGMTAAVTHVLEVEVEHPTFEDWWEPYTFGVGPSGSYVAALDDEARRTLREHCRRLLGDGPFTVPARAWAVVWPGGRGG